MSVFPRAIRLSPLVAGLTLIAMPAFAQTTLKGVWVRERKAQVSIECVLVGHGKGHFTLAVRSAEGKIINRRSFLSQSNGLYEIQIPASSSFSTGSFEAISVSQDLTPACQIVGTVRSVVNGNSTGSFYRYDTLPLRSGTQYLPRSAAPAGPSDGQNRSRILIFNPQSKSIRVDVALFTADGSSIEPLNKTVEIEANRVVDISDPGSGLEPAVIAVTPDSIESVLSLLEVQSLSNGPESDSFSIQQGVQPSGEPFPIVLPKLIGSKRRLTIVNTADVALPCVIEFTDSSGVALGTENLTVNKNSSVVVPVKFETSTFAAVKCTTPLVKPEDHPLIAYATITSGKIPGTDEEPWEFKTFPAPPIPSGQPSLAFLSQRPGTKSSVLMWPTLGHNGTCELTTYNSQGEELSQHDHDLINGCLSETTLPALPDPRYVQLGCSTPNAFFGGGILERRDETGSQSISFSPIYGLTAVAALPPAVSTTGDVEPLTEARKLSIEGHLLLSKGKFEEAAAKFRQASKLAPRYQCVLTWLIDAQERGGKRNQALESVRQLLRLDPVNEFGRAKEAQYLVEAGSFNEAESILRDLVSRSPLSPDHNSNLGTVLSNLGNDTEAAGYFERALVVNPNSPLALWGLIGVYEKANRTAEVKSLEDRILAVSPEMLNGNTPQIILLRGIKSAVYSRRKLTLSAIVELKEADKLQPGDHRIVWNISEQLGSLRSWDAALPYARQAVALFPTNPSYVATLGWILLEKNRFEESKQILSKALEDGIESARVHVNLGMAFARTNDLDRARKEFERAVELDPKDWIGFNNLGWIAELQGDLTAAHGNYEKAYSLNADADLVRTNLANIKVKLSAQEKAN